MQPKCRWLERRFHHKGADAPYVIHLTVETDVTFANGYRMRIYCDGMIDKAIPHIGTLAGNFMSAHKGYEFNYSYGQPFEQGTPVEVTVRAKTDIRVLNVVLEPY